jgi:hypothetical protein
MNFTSISTPSPSETHIRLTCVAYSRIYEPYRTSPAQVRRCYKCTSSPLPIESILLIRFLRTSGFIPLISNHETVVTSQRADIRYTSNTRQRNHNIFTFNKNPTPHLPSSPPIHNDRKQHLPHPISSLPQLKPSHSSNFLLLLHPLNLGSTGLLITLPHMLTGEVMKLAARSPWRIKTKKNPPSPPGAQASPLALSCLANHFHLLKPKKRHSLIFKR